MPELEPVTPKPIMLSDEGRAELQAALNRLGLRVRDECAAIIRGLAAVLQPVIDSLVALNRAFEDAGLYDLDPDEIRIGLLEDAADDYAHEHRDTPALAPPAERGTCAHVCGPEPDHECQAAATTVLKHQNFAGGVTRMPLCAPCHASEAAVKEPVDA